MAYCEVTDLFIGDTRLDINTTPPQAFVNSASDEIDAALGYMYITPICPEDTAVNRPTVLLLKLINQYIATGRLLITIGRVGEDGQLDALGKYYLNLGMTRLQMIVDGKIDLLGATHTEGAPTNTGPQVVNAEPMSLVDMFYSEMNPSNPGFWVDPIYRHPRPGVTF